MTVMSFADAVWDAIAVEMRRDSRVLVMGQDVEFDTPAIWREFGARRVRNTPISEGAFIGAAIGAALTGLRPVVVLGCSTFLYSAMDQVVNQAAKIRYMFGGQANVPIVIRAPVVYGVSAAAHHADRPWGMFAQAPGLKIVVPTTPREAKGLMTASIRDGNPVLFFEDSLLSESQGEVSGSEYVPAIGTADIKRAGVDVTIVAVAAAVRDSLAAAEILEEEEGVSAEVIDVRSVAPLDRPTVLRSVMKTGRLLVVDPAPGTCSVAAEIVATVAEDAWSYLRAPIIRLTAPDVPVPFSPALEQLMYPSVARISAAACRQCKAGLRQERAAHA